MNRLGLNKQAFAYVV